MNRRHFIGIVAILTALLGACTSSTAPDAHGGSSASAYTGPAEGDWLPTVGGNATYNVQTGRWSRLGNTVWVTGTLYINTLGSGSSGQISGLPFESVDGQEPSGTVGYWQGLNLNMASLMVTVRPNSSTLAFHGAINGASDHSPTVSPLQSGSLVYFSVTYEAKP